MAAGFAGAIPFMERLGVYDVILPFLLVFTLMYAFLEKTKVFGTETYFIDGDPSKKTFTGSRRNLNAMTSFVVAFFVIASSQLVAVINQSLSHMVLLLVLVFCFILVAGSFQKQTDEGFFLDKGWRTLFMLITFIAIVLIFLNALGWLEPTYDWLKSVWDNEAVASIVLIGLIVLFIWWVTKDPTSSSNSSKKES